jgi:hypothetical protein
MVYYKYFLDMNNKRKKRRRAWDLKQQGWTILELAQMILEHFGAGILRASLSSLKSELQSELHCIIKCMLLFFLVFFLEVSSLEFPVEIFLATYPRETLINEWDALWTESSDGVQSLGWKGQEEERWR